LEPLEPRNGFVARCWKRKIIHFRCGFNGKWVGRSMCISSNHLLWYLCDVSGWSRRNIVIRLLSDLFKVAWNEFSWFVMNISIGGMVPSLSFGLLV
jgi:hypothetical protein